MSGKTPDYYEILQVSQRADGPTIERVFRHLAKMYHPDNKDTGDSDRFTQVVEAFRVLSDPEARVEYDAGYESVRRNEWKVLDQESAANHVEADRRIRIGILTLLYTERRKNVNDPGLGSLELEQTLGCLEEHMNFHVWYLKESKWVERLQNGQYAITVAGIDELTRTKIPWQTDATGLLKPANDPLPDDEVTTTPPPELEEGEEDTPDAEAEEQAEEAAPEPEPEEEEKPQRSRVIA